MVDIQGKGYITYPEFEFVMECTQRMMNYVDEYATNKENMYVHP